jgi:hypothetical protein
MFQHHRGGRNRNQALQPFEWLLQPTAQIGADVKTANMKLGFHELDDLMMVSFPAVAGLD